MRILNISYILLTFFILASCKKDESNAVINDSELESYILSDFANVLVIPNYLDIQTNAELLKSNVEKLNTSPTEGNLTNAKDAWKSTRLAWEKAEGYLLGPVEDFNYDPTIDTWPLNKLELDSLLSSTNPLSNSDVESLPYSLKGFHAIEYILFGINGTKKAEAVTVREKQYLSALCTNLVQVASSLYLSWDISKANNFSNELIMAGKGGTRFATRKDALISIVTAMAGICDEVANGKMEDPLVAKDASLEESQFAHSSTNDFKNNIISVQNAYLCKYKTDGHGLNEMVASKNISLDNTIQNNINSAIASFDALNANYGEAIFSQVTQIHNTQDLINSLKTSLEVDLMNFIQTNIKD